MASENRMQLHPMTRTGGHPDLNTTEYRRCEGLAYSFQPCTETSINCILPLLAVLRFISCRSVIIFYCHLGRHFSFTVSFNEYRPLHALRSIMGDQGKFIKKQSCKTHVFVHISIPISHLETKRTVNDLINARGVC